MGLGSLSGGGHSWALGFWGEQTCGGCCPFLLSPALSFHVIPLSLFTFWPLSKSTLLGLLQKGGGSVFSATWK